MTSPTPQPPNRRAAAHAVTAALIAAAFAAVFAVTDVPLGPAHDDSRGAAALAIRDHVIPFQKWGTRLFTIPTLEAAYAETHYFTQNGRGHRREAFVQTLEDALRRHESVDLFLAAHTNTYYRWVVDIDPALRHKLRLVYNTGCSNAEQGALWVDLGADTYIGHPGASASPFFYFYFLRRWTRAQPLPEAQADANGKMRAMLHTLETLSGGALDAETIWLDSEAQRHGRADTHIDAP